MAPFSTTRPIDITDEMLAESFLAGVANVAALSLELKIPTLASLPHTIVNAYKNVLAVALDTKYSFPGLEKVKKALAAPVAAAPAEEKKAKPEAEKKPEKKPEAEKKPEKKPEPEPDDGEMDMGALFG